MNIMINTNCNLRCTYCFASFLTHKSENVEMSIESFSYCLEFLKKSNSSLVRILGGEPTIHSCFNEFIDLIINNNFTKLHIFTNGIIPEKSLTKIIDASKKIDLLLIVNLNSEKCVGEINYEHIRYVIKKLRINKVKIILGINIYDPDMDISYFSNAIKEFKIKIARMSIAVPNEKVKDDVETYYRKFIPKVLELLEAMFRLNCKVENDCNSIPICYFTDKELRKAVMLNPNMFMSNKCLPPIDIKPNLDTIRCFGCKDKRTTNLKQFTSIASLLAYFITYIDLPKEKSCHEQCKDCLNTKKCRPACLALL